ncbi:MAG: phosphate signaling complex protein PhoU [Fimbriimonadales bacterium]|nr:phosphate signaling complex protein PhoU [Fimbriimonadales bacterium]
MPSYRPTFDAELTELKARVLRTGAEVIEMISGAVESALSGDPTPANRVIDRDDEIDRAEREVLLTAAKLIMKEQPVAADLRRLLATLGIMGEIERVADDAVKLAKRALKTAGHFPGELKLALQEMADMVTHSFAAALRLYSEFDLELANKILTEEHQVDGKYVENRRRIYEMIREEPEETEQLVRVIEVFHALEHVSDHSVDIAKRLKLHWEGA